jgi:hypothetical protein
LIANWLSSSRIELTKSEKVFWENKKNKDLLDRIMLLDLEEEEMQNKFNRIAK